MAKKTVKSLHCLYEWFLIHLTNHKGLPNFFAHGGLHLVFLIILASIACIMGRRLYVSSLTSFNQIIYTFYGDTLKNYKINHYVSKNYIKDTLAFKAPAKSDYLVLANQWDRMERKSIHDRTYYTSAVVNKGNHVFYRRTNAKGHVVEWGSLNPIFNFWIGIVMDEKVELDDNSVIKIIFNDIRKDNSEEGIEFPLI